MGAGPEPRRAGGGGARRPGRPAPLEPRASLPPSLPSAPLILSPRLELRRPLPAGLSASVCLLAALNSGSGSTYCLSLSLGAPRRPCLVSPRASLFCFRPQAGGEGRGVEADAGGWGWEIPSRFLSSLPPPPWALPPALPRRGLPGGDAWPCSQVQFNSWGLSFPCSEIEPLSSLLWAPCHTGHPAHCFSWSPGGGGGRAGPLLPFFPG